MSDKERLYQLVNIVKYDLDIIDVQYANCPVIISNGLGPNEFGRTIGFIHNGIKKIDRIEIQREMFESYPDSFVISVICHELLHSSPECVNSFCGHDGKWAYLADYVNRMYPDKYVITEFADEFVEELEKRINGNTPLN